MLQQLLAVLRPPADWQVARAVVLLDFSHRKQPPPASETFKAAGYRAGGDVLKEVKRTNESSEMSVAEAIALLITHARRHQAECVNTLLM